jgi:ParB family transcriptional regulator, chromosome partitioning protein
LRAAQQLNIEIKAIVGTFSDEEALIAQGQENSGRKNLTYIERARLARPYA